MPAFTFEKISPPVRRTPAPPVEKKPRSVLGQVVDRFSVGGKSAALRRQANERTARPTPKD